MTSCNTVNQYYSDVTDSNGKIIDSKCYKGVYPSKVNVNSYLNYKSKDYYSWINNTLKDYSFPTDYSAKSFEDICVSKEYSLKPQQKFAARVINTHTDNKGMLIYHGLGSGKTQTSIIIGETFKFRNVKAQKLSGSAYPTDIIQPARTDSVVLIVVPAALAPPPPVNTTVGALE